MKLLYLILIATLAFSCGKKKHHDKNKVEVEMKGDVIVLSPDSPLVEKLKIETLREESFRRELTTSAVVEAIPSRYAEIASPFAGRVVRSFVQLGQKVQVGTPLFEVSSPDFFETGKAYFQAKQEMELARKSLSREKDLFQNRVGVKKELEEAEVNYQLKKRDYENALAALRVFGIGPEELEPGQPLVVHAPIAGKIVKDRLVQGQYLREDAEPMMVIADLDKVWVVAHVKEKDISLIDCLADAEVSMVAMPGKVFPGKVYHISEMLDADTRSVEVLIECDNREGQMRPAMYGSVRLTNTAREALLIPTSAVLQEENHCYVLLALGGNRYRKQEIITSDTHGTQTMVLSGIGAGDRIVTEGAFYLNNVR